METTDTSLEDFLSELFYSINNDNVQNSYKVYNFGSLNYKNQLYNALEYYKNHKTIFYSNYISEYPSINIKRIDNIKMGPICNYEGRRAYESGKYYLRFTVYYEKKINI